MTLTPSQASKVERLRADRERLTLEVEIARLKIELGKVLEQALPLTSAAVEQQLEQAYRQLVEEVEASHPGYTLSPAGELVVKEPAGG